MAGRTWNWNNSEKNNGKSYKVVQIHDPQRPEGHSTNNRKNVCVEYQHGKSKHVQILTFYFIYIYLAAGGRNGFIRFPAAFEHK